MSEEPRKTISITPELFTLTKKGGKQKNQTKKKRPKLGANPLKKALLGKIKSHAQKNNKTLKEKKDFESIC